VNAAGSALVAWKQVHGEELMRWLFVAGCILPVLALTGCPSEFGKDGRVAQAVHHDAKEQVIIIRRCKDDERTRVCAPGKENSKECLECGGPP
jgi:hypothetical protein